MAVVVVVVKAACLLTYSGIPSLCRVKQVRVPPSLSLAAVQPGVQKQVKAALPPPPPKEKEAAWEEMELLYVVLQQGTTL